MCKSMSYTPKTCSLNIHSCLCFDMSNNVCIAACKAVSADFDATKQDLTLPCRQRNEDEAFCSMSAPCFCFNFPLGSHPTTNFNIQSRKQLLMHARDASKTKVLGSPTSLGNSLKNATCPTMNGFCSNFK